MMQRFGFEHDGLPLSYLDTGGDRPLIIALHAMWIEARSFEEFALPLADTSRWIPVRSSRSQIVTLIAQLPDM